MDYDEMIYGLADEMLEKIAADDDDYGYDDGYYEDYDEDYDDYDGITEEDLDYMDDDELEALAEAMYEDELEKTAGCGGRIRGAACRVGKAAKGYGKRLAFGNTRKKQEYVRYAKKHGWNKGDNVDKMYYNLAKKNRNKALRKDLAAYGGTALAGGSVAGTAYGARRLKNRGQEKAAQMYEEAQLYKQAAEETWEEAQMVQDAASVVFDYLGE